MTGSWVVRYADGTVGEGPYVDGEPNGNWVLRYADRGVVDVRYVNGEIVSTTPRR